ncbi:general secretion pathway protein M [Candidatus Photodesmus katoptron]|uniref:General secretion pathway protein M n=1 Tax=Candidatus Photodesmus katoptron Akat1 TaxID=1236703 RepID=S3DII7_9GAMM|nr:type II secretion system protein M [Candidatus Photodesmus katoptron]EPE37535.1 general secretion pathway protein M [Candidatus Photodesmus katoptron Akat1]KEY90185.1 general secretion pathway protein M [Candidatus Photodesmus katoptron]
MLSNLFKILKACNNKYIFYYKQPSIIVCLALIISTLSYFSIWYLLNEKLEKTKIRVNSEKELLSWITEKANTLSQLRSDHGLIDVEDSLNNAITISSNHYQIKLIRVTPDNNSIKVWIQPVEFNKFIDWITYLRQKQGIKVEYLNINRSIQSGVIEVSNLEFQRGR